MIWLTLKLRAGRHQRSLPVFQTPPHVLSEKNFFSLLVYDDSEVFFCLKLCMHLLCFYKGFWELRAKAKSFQIFLWKSLWRLTFEVVALRIFAKKFLRLACKIVETVKTVKRMAFIICHLAVCQICCFRWTKAVPVQFVLGIFNKQSSLSMQNNQKKYSSTALGSLFSNTYTAVFRAKYPSVTLSYTQSPLTRIMIAVDLTEEIRV